MKNSTKTVIIKDMAQYEFSHVIEWSLAEHAEYSGKITSPWISWYSKVLVAYLKSDIKELQRIIGDLENISLDKEISQEALRSMADARFQIRKRKIEPQVVEKLKSFIGLSSLLDGEIHFILGLCFEILSDEENSIKHYLASAKELERIGANKKSVKAHFNALAADSRRTIDKNYLVDYASFIARALKYKSYAVAGMAQMNISREYQKIGANLAALKYINQAIENLSIQDIGSLDYFCAIVHRAHVWLDLDKPTLAKEDVDLAKIAEFREIKNAVKLLQKALGENEISDLEKSGLFPDWKDRLDALSKKNQESSSEIKKVMLKADHEEKVLNLLMEGPQTRTYLMDQLYGKELSFETKENRLKNLLSRIRKKSPELIIYTDGVYTINTTILNLKR